MQISAVRTFHDTLLLLFYYVLKGIKREKSTLILQIESLAIAKSNKKEKYILAIICETISSFTLIAKMKNFIGVTLALCLVVVHFAASNVLDRFDAKEANYAKR